MPFCNKALHVTANEREKPEWKTLGDKAHAAPSIGDSEKEEFKGSLQKAWTDLLALIGQ